METQWRVIAGMSGIRLQGLDNAAVLATLKLMGHKKPARQRLFGELREMQNEALAVFAEAREQEATRA